MKYILTKLELESSLTLSLSISLSLSLHLHNDSWANPELSKAWLSSIMPLVLLQFL